MLKGTYSTIHVEPGEQVFEHEVAVGVLSVHWAAARGALRAQMRMFDEILKALEANVVSIVALARFADQVETNRAAEFQ